jgi:hypothetical protein
MKTRNVFNLILAVALALTACDGGGDKKCTCPEGTTYEPDDKCCEGTDCNCQIAEPAVKEFPNIALFETYTAKIQDNRAACGSKNLEQLGIVNIIKQGITGAFNDAPDGFAGAAHQNKFRNVFGAATGSVTIFVENSLPSYTDIKTPDRYTMNFHVNYLQSNPNDIQQKITTAIEAMNNMPHKE